MKYFYDSRKNFHRLEPDYSGPILEISPEQEEHIQKKLVFLYGEQCGDGCFKELKRIMQVYYAHKSPEMLAWEKNLQNENRFTERDVILITYGDLVRGINERPLLTLSRLCKYYLRGVFNTLHILPFFPYSSDRGFAVMDFEEVDHQMGSWDDILDLKSDFQLMFDGVFNHVSSKSRWFQEFLNQNPEYEKFFTVFSTKEEISPDHLRLIVRPRTSEVVTEFKTLNGPRLVWTTFSPDQIDLNYHHPAVLLKMVEILLTYVRRGADLIRLDAVTYLWEELGTSCAHLDESHVSIQLFRDVLDIVAPHVSLITETNVPHEDNIRYFGDGRNEAQMVYNFALPPLVLHTFQTQNARRLNNWAAGLKKVSDCATYFNFLDSHDGIGVMAVKNILTAQEIEMMTLRVIENGGFISYKAEGDGSESPYEMNITWYSALNSESAGETHDIQVKRFLASRAIAMVFMGVPGIYLHGLLGSRNDAESVLENAQMRSINRRTLKKKELLAALEDEESNIYQVASRLVRLVHYRIREKAFHPNARQRVLKLSDKVFAVVRMSVDKKERIFALINISNGQVDLEIDTQRHKLGEATWRDILSRKKVRAQEGKIKISMEPYQIFWFKQKYSE